MEEGSSAQVADRQFGLVIGEPVHFQFYGSTVRRDDVAGTHLVDWANDELDDQPTIQITLPVSEGRRAGEVVPVTLASRVTALGTLYLEAIAADNGQNGMWNLMCVTTHKTSLHHSNIRKTTAASFGCR